MIERELFPDFSKEALTELDSIQGPAFSAEQSIRDLKSLPWCSIDNGDSRDLDQLTVAEALPDGTVKILVAVADVDAVVKQKSAIDSHALHNTTSVYTAAEVFPMLPERLSTDLTSLSYNEDRLAIVIEIIVAMDGSVKSSDIYKATVRNRAKLNYKTVAKWLEGDGPMPEAVGAVEGLEENIKLQDATTQKMKTLRHAHGALNLKTIEARPVFENDHLQDMEAEEKNRAKEIIEDFMIAANSVAAGFLSANGYPSLQRVVRTPKRWDRIMELASLQEFKLPKEPDSRALDDFLVWSKTADPIRFPDLSLTVIKLLGSGEYVAELPGSTSPGHFGLAVRDYSHSTAPNRRYPDLITQRLLKAALSKHPVPYENDELVLLAKHCTEAENAAKKVERQVDKSAAAMLLESRIGDQFDGIVTGASEKGTWVRLLRPPVEGKLIEGQENVDVGDRLRVQLINTDVERGFIDFKRVD